MQNGKLLGWTMMEHKDGKRHRDGDLPAVIYASVSQIWAKYHRDGDLPATTGGQAWFKDGWWHRDVGPANLSSTNQPKYVTYGARRGARSSLGETMQSRTPASWSPALCFM